MPSRCDCGRQTNNLSSVCTVCQTFEELTNSRKHNVTMEKETVMAGEKVCVDCEKPYKPASNVQKRCVECGIEHKKRKDAELRVKKKGNGKPVESKYSGVEIYKAASIKDAVAAMSPPEGALTDTENEIFSECELIGSMLVTKNRAYGNSALNPVRIFSHADPLEQLKVRIDDKLSRLMRGNASGEDTVSDLIGYLILLKIQERRNRKEQG